LARLGTPHHNAGVLPSEMGRLQSEISLAHRGALKLEGWREEDLTHQ